MKVQAKILIIFFFFIGYNAYSQNVAFDPEVVYIWNDSIASAGSMVPIDEDYFMVSTINADGKRYISKMTYEDTHIVASTELPDNRIFWFGRGGYIGDTYRFISFKDDRDADTLPMLYAIDVHPDDLTLALHECHWEGTDFNHVTSNLTSFYQEGLYSVFLKDGSMVLSYPVGSLYSVEGKEAMHFVRFNQEFDIVSDRILYDLPYHMKNFMFITSDSLCFRLITTHSGSPYSNDCRTYNSDLEEISVIENIDNLCYPYMSCDAGCNMVRFNPHNGRTYSIAANSEINFGKSNTNVFMSVFDGNFNQLNYEWGIVSPTTNDSGVSIAFGADGKIFFLGWMNWILFAKSEEHFDCNNLYVGLFDENLNKNGELYFKSDWNLFPSDVCPCPDGGCLVALRRHDLYKKTLECCIYRFTPEAFLSVDEAHANGLKVAIAYPNPGGNEMHIRTMVENAAVEVYDMNGRLVAQQPVMETETVLDATDWASGEYVWKVVSGVSTNSTTLVESGKWAKR